MKIKRLELKNFRTLKHIVLEDLPAVILLVSPNGRGKSSILEAIAGVHDLVAPYHQENYGFQQLWQQRHVKVWPPHLAPPVKLGEHRAEVAIEVEAEGPEQNYLKAAGIQTAIGRASFVIEGEKHITTDNSDDAIKRLFRYHNPKDGIGFIDYIRPVRFYLNRPLGNFSNDMSDDRTKNVFMEFHHPSNHHEKFASFKSFVVSSQLNDFSHLQTTRHERDSLAVFREVFDHFFAPKKFAGYRISQDGGEPQVVVESPFGDHDTDSLSSGEKEVLHQLAHLYRFRHLHNVVLWDTPESHLNAALESRLYEAIRRIAPNNQTWIATHSLELIDSVPLEEIFVIRQNGNSAVVERQEGGERSARVSMYRDLGARLGLQLVSSVVAFVEGKHAHSDKRILDRLAAPDLPGVNFVAGGSCENILSVGTKANDLLAESCANGDFLAIVDRDYRDDAEVADLVGKYRGRLFVWSVHEIENLFLDPEAILHTLRYLDLVTHATSTAEVMRDLKSAAESLREWIAADWVAGELDRRFQPPARRIAGDNPRKSLEEYLKGLGVKVQQVADPIAAEKQYQDKLREVDSLLGTDQWIARLPGKQILKRFLEKFNIPMESFIKAAASTIVANKIPVPEIERLKKVVRELPAPLK